MIYDPFQEEAIGHINKGFSVIVSAPTGAGKTVIAEHVIYECIEKDTKVIYTAPIKALSNQKFRDFQKIFGDKIGILTGDVSINPHAQVLIMTTEIFRNKLIEKEASLDNYSWIIFDEVHYLDDYQRGSTWEESLIFLPEHMNILALSATIPNIDELAEWFASIHKRPLKVVKEDKRPVPLHFYYQYEGRIVDNTRKLFHIRPSRSKWRHSQISPRHRGKPNRPTSLIRHLYERQRLPCIYFTFGRRRCEYLACEMAGFRFVNSAEAKELDSTYRALCERFDLIKEKSAAGLRPLIQNGIAYHHAGMLPTLKEAVERLFTSRLIKVIFTTETFALGINMPARTVVFDELRKYYGRFFATLRTRDFYQMAGRAGRRGIDNEGFVYSRINPHYISFQELKRVIYGNPEKVTSKFNASYATILNLYEKHKEALYDVYPSSFHYFQQKDRFRKKALELLHSKVDILKALNHIKDDSLTPKGDFASKVYGYELPLAELYETVLLERLSETELGILSVALVFEPRKNADKPRLSKKIRGLRDITDNIVSGIHKKEKAFGIRALSKECYYHLSPCLEAWMRGEDFSAVLQHTDADEGGVIRFFRMGVQILREILNAPISGQLKEKARKTIGQINRDIVDAEKQLRE